MQIPSPASFGGGIAAQTRRPAKSRFKPAYRKTQYGWSIDYQGGRGTDLSLPSAARSDKVADNFLEIVVIEPIHHGISGVELLDSAPDRPAIGIGKGHIPAHNSLARNAGQMLGMVEQRHCLPGRADHHHLAARFD